MHVTGRVAHPRKCLSNHSIVNTHLAPLSVLPPCLQRVCITPLTFSNFSIRKKYNKTTERDQRTSTPMFHTYILLVGACLPLVAASVYPTQPIQATVWSADQPMLVTWIEDWKNPVLSEMGLLDISLWRDTDVSIPVRPCHDVHELMTNGWG